MSENLRPPKRKRMRQAFCLALIAVAVAALTAGCGSGESTDDSANSSASSSGITPWSEDEWQAKLGMSFVHINIDKAVINGAPNGQDLESYLEAQSQRLVDYLDGAPDERMRLEIDQALEMVGMVDCDSCEEILRDARP